MEYSLSYYITLALIIIFIMFFTYKIITLDNSKEGLDMPSLDFMSGKDKDNDNNNDDGDFDINNSLSNISNKKINKKELKKIKKNLDKQICSKEKDMKFKKIFKKYPDLLEDIRDKHTKLYNYNTVSRLFNSKPVKNGLELPFFGFKGMTNKDGKFKSQCKYDSDYDSDEDEEYDSDYDSEDNKKKRRRKKSDTDDDTEDDY